MTALDKFIRLEAVGQWRENHDAQSVEVIVSFGDSTLQLTSLQDNPITHWALLATQRIGTKGSAVTYATDTESGEVLVIDDTEMNRAITAVTQEITGKKPAKRRLSGLIWLAGFLAIIALLSQSGPLIYGWTAKLTSPARLTIFTEKMESQILDNTVLLCRENRAQTALTSFSTSLQLDNTVELRVFQQSGTNMLALPNGRIYLSSQPLTNQNVETFTATVVVAVMMQRRNAALLHVLAQNGVIGSIRHLFGKDIQLSQPMTFPAPIAEDFVAARDHLVALGFQTKALQQLAASYGFGLPIEETIQTNTSTSQMFAAIRQYCGL